MTGQGHPDFLAPGQVVPVPLIAEVARSLTVMRYDTFNRADAAVLGTPSDGGSAWAMPAPGYGQWQISSNAANGQVNALDVLDFGTTDVTLEASILIPSRGIGFAVRVTDGDNLVTVQIENGVLLTVRTATAGVETLRTSAVLALVVGSTHTLKVVTSGSTLTAYVDGALVLTWTILAAYLTQTLHGIYAKGTPSNGAIDNLNANYIRNTYTTVYVGSLGSLAVRFASTSSPPYLTLALSFSNDAAGATPTTAPVVAIDGSTALTVVPVGGLYLTATVAAPSAAPGTYTYDLLVEGLPSSSSSASTLPVSPVLASGTSTGTVAAGATTTITVATVAAGAAVVAATSDQAGIRVVVQQEVSNGVWVTVGGDESSTALVKWAPVNLAPLPTRIKVTNLAAVAANMTYALTVV